MKNIDFGPVADLYDVYVQWDVDVPFFRSVCAETEKPVLELMCGTGRLSIPLLESGAELCCVDYSAEMLAVLRRKLDERGLTADVREADVRELDLGRTFERIILPFHSIAEIVGRDDRVRALARVREHLTPEGRFVITLHNPAVQLPRLDGQRRQICDRAIPDRDANLLVWSTARYLAGEGVGEALQEYEITEADGRLVKTCALQLRFAIIGPDEFETELAEAGFAVLRLWGDYERKPFEAETSPHLIWEVERRP